MSVAIVELMRQDPAIIAKIIVDKVNNGNRFNEVTDLELEATLEALKDVSTTVKVITYNKSKRTVINLPDKELILEGMLVPDGKDQFKLTKATMDGIPKMDITITKVGDIYGYKIVKSLKENFYPDTEFNIVGNGGEYMKKHGQQSIIDLNDLFNSIDC